MRPPNTILSRTFSFFAALALTVGAFAAEQPNIIVIITDDQGYGDFGFTGNEIIDTPNLDRLAIESARMTQFYVSPVCAPTRASLMTGRYSYRTRVVDTWVGRSMMEPTEVTLAESLKAAGYQTGIFGKWHLGDCYPMRPLDQGFDVSYIHKGGGLGQPSDPLENDNRYTDPILWDQGVEFQSKGYCTDLFFGKAVDFVEAQHRADKPFFAYIAPNAPHGPYHDVPEELYQKYKAMDLSSISPKSPKSIDTVARVYAMIENIDDNVGLLLNKLSALGIERETIVVFLTDNGPNTRRYVGPFRGKKTEVHQGGIRSPFLFRWPARIEAGTTSDINAAHIDIMPTLLDAAGVALPQDRTIDGRSLLSLLSGKDTSWAKRSLVLQSHRGDEPQAQHHMALIDGPWKLVRPTGFQNTARLEDVPFELYHIASDPGEKEELSATNPEVVKRLTKAYDQWFADVSTTRADNFAKANIILGKEAPAITFLTKQEWRPTEGSSWGTQGFWQLKATEDCVYTVETIFEEPVEGKLTLIVGDATYNKNIRKKELQNSFEFSEISIPAGPFKLECFIEVDGKKTAVYHIDLRKE